MSKITIRFLVAAVLVAAGSMGSVARADISHSTATNTDDGSNRASTNQGGKSGSGDAVGGQVTGVVSAGRASVDATDTSKDSSVSSGDARGSNTSRSFVGLSRTGGDTEVGADLSFITIPGDGNLQEGDNRQTLAQTSAATTGDGVAGQVIGAVTAAGGSASIVAANTSVNVDVSTGVSDASNESNAFVGLGNSSGEFEVGVEDISNVTSGSSNIQQGANRQSASQSATAATGDGVAGQVIGAVSAGAMSIDATNRSNNDSVSTGDARSSNASSAVVGQVFIQDSSLEIGPADITNVTGDDRGLNIQEGSNRQAISQTAKATSGDGVAGEVIGAVTSSGGSVSIVAANTSTNDDVTTGDAASSNASAAFVGLALNGFSNIEIGGSDISGISGHVMNIQQGTNRQTLNESATSSTGDGVAGQVIGAVSAGATSIDATNSSDDVGVQTGDARVANSSDGFVGLVFVGGSDLSIGATDISNVNSSDHLNVQEGNNTQTLAQNAVATSGDGVAGEVIGAVTSAGGSASIVAANSTKITDVRTGDARATNSSDAVVGLANTDRSVDVADISGISTPNISNVQDGNNRLTLAQSASASSGDGVGGQVLGVVSAGRVSLNATNRTEDSSVQTGDATASSTSADFVGLVVPRGGDLDVGDVSGVNLRGGGNVQDGNNTRTYSQAATATSGDGVAGQVGGVVTSAGGSASAVLANTSTSIDSRSGDAVFSNGSAAFVGQAVPNGSVTIGPLT